MAERRNRDRIEADYRIEITVRSPDGTQSESNTFCCSTEDISPGGLRFDSDVVFERDQPIDLLVVLRWSYWGFPFKGRVAWVRKRGRGQRYSVGVQFIDPPEATRLAWEEALQQVAS